MKMGKKDIFRGIGIKKFRAAFLSVLLISAVFVGMLGIMVNMVGNVEADQGGPDAYGYIWINNTAPPPLVSYNWVEITSPANETGVTFNDDGGTFSIGFPFTFYGNTYNDVNLYSHGYIDFGPLGSSDYTNDPIPDSSNTPHNLIAAYWDDLIGFDPNPGIYATTIGTSPDRTFVVQWNTTDGTDTLNFEIILHETSNNITMQYNNVTWNGSGATVGIENSDGTIGLEHSYDAASSVFDGLAIVYTFVPPAYRVSLTPDFQMDFGYPTWDVDHILTVTNSGINDDTYDLSSLNVWLITFRDIGDTMDITSISIAAGNSADFIARVSVPGGALPGDFDLANLNASSQNDSTVYDTARVQTQVPYNVNWLDGFELVWDGWTAEIINPGSSPTNWEIGDPMFTGPGTAYNGTNCSGTNIMDGYYSSADICLVTPFVQLGGTPQILSFYHWYNMNTMDNDGGFVEISVNGGSWNQIWPIVGYPSTGGYMGGYNTDGYSGSSAGWEYDEFDLSAYANQVVQVRFHFAASPWWGGQWGWYLDDVYLGSPPPYRVELIPDYQMSFGNPGTDVDFILTAENTGASDDTYDLNAISLWTVTFRDIGDTTDITTISVAAGNSENFIVRVSVPGAATPGDVGFSSIFVFSQNDSSVSDNALVETNVPIVPPWFDDMESGPGPWQNWTDGDGTEWQLGDPTPWPWGPPGAYSPNNCWGTNIASNYTNDGEATLTTAYVDLSGAATAYLTFWHWYDINGGVNDAGWVEVSDDYGSSWTRIFPIGGYPDLDGWSGLPCYAGTTAAWVQAYFDLSAYSGDMILIQFHFRDVFWDGVERSGWYVDDVSIYASVYAVEISPDSVGFGNPGDTVQYTLTVNNTGFSDDSFALSVSGNIWTTTIYESTGTFVITNTGFLAAGNSIDIVVKVDIPLVVNPGAYDTATITATSDNDTVISDSAEVDTNYPIAPPWFDDMESGVGPWRTWDNGAFTIWQLGDPSPWPWGPGSAYSGANCWGTNIWSNYTTGGEATLTTPYINLSLAVDANLTFWHWYDINGMWTDGGWVEVSDDYGSSWTRIDPIGGYPDFDWQMMPCYAGTTAAWVQAELDLTAYTGSMIVIRFHFRDFPLDGVERSGWYIDDINVSAIYVPYGVNLIPDMDFDFGLNGTMVLYMMTATNIGTIGSDTFDLTATWILGWPVTFYDLGMNPITSVGPLATGASQDFYAGVNIPVAALPMTQETTWVTATSQNDPSINPANDTSTLLTEVLAQILFVDDDGGIDTEVNFTAAFIAGGYEYNIWNYSKLGPPDLGDLQQHEVVVWCTGNDWIDTTLTPTDRAKLGTYLDNGGKLYLSSSWAGLDAYNDADQWQAWYQTYLHSNFVNLLGFGVPSVLNGISNDPISDGLTFNIHQGDFNPNLMGFWTDNTPVNMGVTFFTEPSPGNVATRADTGTYRMVYTAFDFADVDGAANRALLMERILKWLQFGDLPYVLDTIPINNAIGVAIDQNMVVIYSESMNTMVTPTLAQVPPSPDPGNWVFVGWSTTNVANDTATWTHDDWTPGQDVNMSVSGGEDLEGNTASVYLWNFTIIAAANPWATAIGPISSGTNNPSPTITYNYGNSPTNVQIYWSNDGGLSWNMWGTDNSVDGSWPAGSPLPASGTYYWSARAMGGPSEPVPSGPGDIEAGPYVLDIDAPTIQSTTPLDEAIGVSTAAGTYVIEFSEPMDIVGTPATDLPGIVWTWDPSGLWLNGTYTALSPSTTYYVDLTGLGFQDLVGNGLTGDTYKNFTTVAAANPWATATGPISVLTNDPSPTVTYTYGNGPASVEIYWSDDGGASWNLWGTDATVDGSWSAVSPLPASGTYDWNARAIGITNETAPSGAGDIEAGSYVLDIDAPSITSTTPADEATGVSTAAGIYIIEFNEPMSPVGIPSTDLPITVWDWDPSGLWLNGTYTVLAPSTTYYVDLTGLGFQDLAGNALTGDTYKNFTTEALVNPWATATAPISSGTNDASPTIFYDYGNTPTSVEIYYSDDDGLSWTLWGTDSSVDGSWTPGTSLPASGTYYWNARALGPPDEAVPSGSGDIEVGAYVLDIDAPTITSTTPPDEAASVGTAAGTYVIQFSEPMSLVGTPLSDLPGISWVWDASGLWLNGTYTALTPSTTYYVDLTGLGFQDIVGNALTGDTYKNFTTAAGPWASVTGPSSSGTNNDSPTITYDYGSAPTSVEIYYSDDGGGSWNLWGTDASVDNSWPAGSPLPSSGTYYWNARALGALDEPIPTGPSDIESGPYVLDIDPPTIISTIPIDEATGVSTAAGTYVIEFNEPMTTGLNPLSDLPGLLWSWDASSIWLNGTYTALSPGTTYYVDLTSVGFTDLVGNALTGDTYKNFTTSANPWANATAPISSGTNDASPTILYDYGNAPTSVEIYYSDDGGSSWTLWGSDLSVDGSWIPGTSLPASGTYYWNARALGALDETVPTGPSDIEAGSYVLDIDAPTISSTTPLDGATGVGTVAGTYVIEFSEPMDTVGTPLSDLPGLVWTWDPSGLWLNGTYTALLPGTTYYVDLFGLGFQDLAGNALTGDIYKDFTTQPPDTTPPTVVSGTPTSPPAVSIGANIVMVFNESMNTTSVENAFSYTDGTTIWDISDGIVNWNEPTNDTLTFNPSANFGYSTTYTVTINGSIAKDLNDNTLDGNKNGIAEGSPIDDHSWSFTTEPVPDTTPPTSSVGSLDPYQTTLTFNILWTADDPSGILHVELYYTTDGGSTWNKYGTTFIFSPISFTAPDDGEYGFYVIATDNSPLQNRETPPSSGTPPDRTTIVDTTPPTIDAGPDVTTNSEFTRDASASDDTSGIATYEWTKVSGPGAIDFGDLHAEDTTVSADTDGTYVIRLTVTDIVGNSEYDEFTLVWDTTSPTVTIATPTGTEVQITSTISITFNEAMNHASVQNAFNFTDGTTVWTIANGSVSWVGNTMTFTPTVELSYGTSYTVNIGTAAQDQVGNGLATVYTWSFTTAQAPDTTSPTVSSVSLEGEDVEVTNKLSITFDEPMDHASVEGAITISPEVEIINYSWVGNTLTITFESDLEYGADYTVTIGTGAQDEAGNALEGPHSWDFSTKEKEEEAAFPLWLALLIVIIVIVILLVLFLMKGKKKPEELPEEKAAEEIGLGAEEEIGEEAEKVEGEVPGEEAKEELGEEAVEKEVEKPEGELEEKLEDIAEEEKKESEEL